MNFKYALTDQLANSFVSLDEANDYFDTCFKIDEWADSSDDDKKRSLIKATEIIDSYRFHFDKLYSDQMLKLPHLRHEVKTGKADSGSATTVVCSDLTDEELYFDDYWNNGAIRVIEGTNEGKVSRITDFVLSTGTVTFETMTTACDNTTEFELIRELPRTFKYAVCELAVWLLRNQDEDDIDPRIQAVRAGNTSETYFKNDGEINLPPKVKSYLLNYISRTGRIIE